MANQVLYGFLEHEDIFAERITATNAEVVNDAIQRSVDEHNRQMDALLALFAQTTTQYTARFYLGGGHRLQPLDNDGRARPIRVSGHYDIGLPIQQAGSAWGANYVARTKMTVADANRITASMLIADNRWMRDHLLSALYNNATWTFDDDENGALTVQPLANGDAVTYQLQTGADSAATDTHFAAQAGAIADAANPFPAIAADLTEHPENAGATVLSLIPTNLKASVQALGTFFRESDPNIRRGVGVDELVGQFGAAVPGTILGYEEDSGAWVAEWPSLPADYIISVAVGDTARPLAMRQDEEAELQGFKQVATRDDHPFYESQWLRRAGFGAWNRVGAHVMRIGNGSYAVPTGYAAPMP